MEKIRYGHVTKTGGISIEKALIEHHPYVQHNHRIMLNEKQIKREGITFSFASVRHPVDLAVDRYNYFKKYHKYTFIEFLRKCEELKRTNIWCYEQHRYCQNGKHKVDDLFRIETFEDDWKRIINGRLGIETPMLHLNKTSEKLITKTTQKQRDIIYNVYKEDYKLLGYKN